MSSYISFPIEKPASELLTAAYQFIKDNKPGWMENDANLDTWLLQISATQAADLLAIATDIPDTIFRYFGRSLIGFPDIVATQATVPSTWTMRDSGGYTIPAGTQVGVYNDINELIPFTVATTVVVPPGSSATAAGAVTLVAIEAGEVGSGLGAPAEAIELIDPLEFVLSVIITAATTGGVDSETDDEYRTRLVRRLRRLSTRPILPQDFADMSTEIVGVARAVAIDGYNPEHNLLTLNQASLETDATGWAAETNTTVSRQTTVAADGAASLRLRSTAGGNMVAVTTPNNQVAVVPGEQLTAIAAFRTAVTVRQTRISIRWLTAALATISATDGALVNDAVATWNQVTVTGIAPATAAFAQIVVTVLATGAANEDHFIDKVALRRGSATTWSAGGTAASNNERMIAVAGIDENGANLSGAKKSEIDALLEANREVNFIVSVMDPSRTTIKSDFTFALVPGYVAADVEVAAEAAMADYLSPAKWGRDQRYTDAGIDNTWVETTVIYYNELIQLISNVEGVDRVVTLTYAKGADALASPASIVLAGPAALTEPGVINGTAV